jgi:hypothetical protein
VSHEVIGRVEEALLRVEEHRQVDDPGLLGVNRWKDGCSGLAFRGGWGNNFYQSVAESNLVVSFAAKRTSVFGLSGNELTFDHLLMQRMQNWCTQPLMEA